MDAFQKIDNSLKEEPRSREDAFEILAIGVKEGTLADVAGVIASRCGVEPAAVVLWYARVLRLQVEHCSMLLEKVTELAVTRGVILWPAKR